MSKAQLGVSLTLAFVFIEAIQYVFFGNIFQRVSPYLFGAWVFGIVLSCFLIYCYFFAPQQLKRAYDNRGMMIRINLFASLAWGSFLMGVQLIEPAVAYTIGAGVMPITAVIIRKLGVPEGDMLRNKTEVIGNILILFGVLYLCYITLAGHSGFVRGDIWTALAGIICAIFDGVLFTFVMVYGQRLDKKGVAPATIFGLRQVLYVFAAIALVQIGVDSRPAIDNLEFAWIILLGIILIVPPLYALQCAIPITPVLTIGTLTALGPFIIFILQMIEGRVEYSTLTLIGLHVYFVGVIIASVGAVRAKPTTVSE